ncbi:acyl CoA:acetate/3-ketoacid CoA transferase [bacterium]|nr:acyl CoA:acetate/3-ketoacid CoA transferase [bacterium]
MQPEMHMSRRDRIMCTAAEAVESIKDGQTLVIGGFVGASNPEALTTALEQKFLGEGEPRDLTLVYAAGQGDRGRRGANHLAHRGLLKRVIGGHFAMSPALCELIFDNAIEAYNFPQGVLCQLFRDIAAGRPGCLTHVGLDTFMDPLQVGGRLNSCTSEDLIERVEVRGRPWLLYHSFPVDVALIRATAADPFGNLVTDLEPLIGEILPVAQAVHNSGGKVIAQVRDLLDEPVHPQRVRVPGVLVDKIVVGGAGCHPQTFCEELNLAYCSASPLNVCLEKLLPPMEMDERRIIAARACDELPEGAIANLGIGMPEGIARIAAERGLLGHFTLTVESGQIGGIPAGGLSFGASVYPQAIVDEPAQFDFYDGGGLDFAALGAAEIDAEGNVNVAIFGPKIAGVGGFINITQNARRLVFCGTMTAGGLEVRVQNGRLTIVKEGSIRKFVKRVEQISFSAEHARHTSQQIHFVTERAVFKLGTKGIELIEIAPGVDLDRDILAQMEFQPVINEIRMMSPRVFECRARADEYSIAEAG